MAKNKPTPAPNPPSIGSSGLIITEDDLKVNTGEIHHLMMQNSSVKGGVEKNKKKYNRKKKHKGK